MRRERHEKLILDTFCEKGEAGGALEGERLLWLPGSVRSKLGRSSESDTCERPVSIYKYRTGRVINSLHVPDIVFKNWRKIRTLVFFFNLCYLFTRLNILMF